jgi:hypothetical protein
MIEVIIVIYQLANAEIDLVKIRMSQVQYFTESISCLIGYTWLLLLMIKYFVYMEVLEAL